MYFDMKSYLKSTCNYTAKHALRHLKRKKLLELEEEDNSRCSKIALYACLL